MGATCCKEENIDKGVSNGNFKQADSSRKNEQKLTPEEQKRLMEDPDVHAATAKIQSKWKSKKGNETK